MMTVLIHRLKKLSLPLLFAIALLLGFFWELLGFQLDDICLKLNGPERVELDLSSFPGYDGTGIPILPEESGSGTFSFDNLCIPTQNVTVTLSGSSQVLEGTLSICDDASAWQTVGSGQFLANPGGSLNSFTTRIQSHGSLTRLRITFPALEDAVFITSVIFNDAHISFSWLRILLFTAGILALLLIFRYELYAEVLDLKKRSHMLLSLGMLAFCLALCFLFFHECMPSGDYLKTMPTQASLHDYQNKEIIDDAYAEQLDAFEKGQIRLDLGVSPELAEMDNPYDKGERGKKGIEYHWDRAYYDGAYYSYFGLAPLFTVYYPVYLMTGEVPSALLCLSILGAFAIVCAYAAIHGLLRFFRIRANLLLYLLGLPAVMCGGMLYMLQTNTSFYYYPVMSGLGWLSAFLALSFYACSLLAERQTDRTASSDRNHSSASQRGLKKCLPGLLLFCAGLSVVMLVLSRPNLLLLAIVFVLPAYLRIVFDKKTSLGEKASVILPFLIPVIIGGVGICWYNYIRFDSITEFGTTYQLTESDIHYNQLTLSFHHLKAMLYHYFLEPLNLQEFFPFLDLNWTSCYDYGNYLYYECNAGLLNLPLNLGLLLLPCTCLSGQKKAPLQKSTYALAFLGILALGYLDFTMGGIHIRYVCDLALAVSILSLLLVLEHVSFTNVKSGRILYTLALAALLITIAVGILLAFANESNVLLNENPDFYIRAARFLRNW